MTEETTQREGEGRKGGTGGKASQAVEERQPLESGRGATTIADAVVGKVAGLAAREVPGVHDMGGGAARAVGGLTSRIGLSEARTQGVGVEVGEREAAIDLTLTIEYGESIPQVSNAVRDNVVKRIEGITGLSVTEVNISVTDLYFPGDEQTPEEPPPPPRVS